MNTLGDGRTPPRAAIDAGAWIRTAALAATALFTVLQAAAVVRPQGLVLGLATAWSLLLFFVGAFAFLVALVVAAGRSRDATVTLAGFIWLSGVAPPPVARLLRGALAAQVVVAVASAAIRPFTAVAFGILVPMYGLGCLTVWSARHGSFPPIAGMPTGTGRVDRSVATEPGPAGTARPGEREASSTTGAPTGAEDPDDFDDLFGRRRRRRRGDS